MIRLKYFGIILFSIFFITTYGQSKSNKNHIVTKCLDGSIEITLVQDEPFSGSVSIEGHEDKDTCRKMYENVKNPILSVLHEPCAPKNKDIVEVMAVIKPITGSKIVHQIKCDYTLRDIKAKNDLRIRASSNPNPTVQPDEATKNNLYQNVMQMWKTIDNILCDCNLKTYVNKIKSFVKLSN